MDRSEYLQCLDQLTYGKRLHTAVYIYRDTASSPPSTTTPSVAVRKDLIAQLVTAFQIGPEYNLLKFRTDELKVSFLSYPDFLADPHPALR